MRTRGMSSPVGVVRRLHAQVADRALCQITAALICHNPRPVAASARRARPFPAAIGAGVPGRGGDRGAAGAPAEAGLGAGLPRGRRGDRPVRPQVGAQPGSDFRRVGAGRRAAPVRDRPGAVAAAAVGDAARGVRCGCGAGGELRAGDRAGRGSRFRTRAGDRQRGGSGPRVFLDRVRFADPGRTARAAESARTAGVRDPAVPGPGRDSADRGDPAFGFARPRTRRGASLLAVGAAGGGRDRAGGDRRPLRAAAGVPCGRQDAIDRGLDRDRAAGGDRRRMADATGRYLDGAGTFLAGVLLADSEYRHELETNIAPFEGLLLGLFFITVGMGVNLALLAQHPWIVVGLVALLLACKAPLLWSVGRLAPRMTGIDALRLAALLAGGGEFAF